MQLCKTIYEEQLEKVEQRIKNIIGSDDLIKENICKFIDEIVNEIENISWWIELKAFILFLLEYEDILEEKHLDQFVDKIIKYKSAQVISTFVQMVKLSDKNIHKLVNAIIILPGNLEAIYLFALNVENISKDDLDKFVDVLASKPSSKITYLFALNVKKLTSENMEKLVDAVIVSNVAKYMSLFAIHVKNIKQPLKLSLINALLKTNDERFISKYIIETKDYNLMVEIYDTIENFIFHLICNNVIYDKEDLKFFLLEGNFKFVDKDFIKEINEKKLKA